MRSKVANFGIMLCLFVMLDCQNVGFVEKTRQIARGEFGVDVFVLGPTANGDFLNTLYSGFPSTCSPLVGIDRANCFCQATGDQQGRNREYRAWLSINGVVDAICNIQGQVTIGCSVPANIGPFQTEKQQSSPIIAWDYAELSTTGSRVPLSYLEGSMGLIWTGSTAAGRATGQDCVGWTVATSGNFATAGEQSLAGTAFSAISSPPACNSVGTLLCFERIR